MTSRHGNVVLNSRNDAHVLLDELDAPDHLKTHVRLVGEAADLLIEKFSELGLPMGFDFIRIGVANGHFHAKAMHYFHV